MIICAAIKLTMNNVAQTSIVVCGRRHADCFEIISQLKEDWPTLYKIRYIYLEIGKRFYKDVDFFFSADGKLGDANLSISEIKDNFSDSLPGNRLYAIGNPVESINNPISIIGSGR